MKIPLVLRLKKQAHRNIALAQDIIIEQVYNYFSNAVLHGGTAIWRCYNSNRFSEDIDVYIPKNKKSIEAFFESLKNKDFIVIKKKITKNSLFSILQFDRVIVRFKALFKKPLPKGSLAEFERANASLFTVYVLTPEELINEKVYTYLKRRKIRDLYDIFFLLRHVRHKIKIFKALKEFITKFKNPPDEKELKVLIIEGIVPSSNKMLDYIKREANYGKREIS